MGTHLARFDCVAESVEVDIVESEHIVLVILHLRFLYNSEPGALLGAIICIRHPLRKSQARLISRFFHDYSSSVYALAAAPNTKTVPPQ
ncbi:hypothetical protein D3C72_2226180 [compost metagenome]